MRAARALQPVIAARAPEVEAARRVPPDLLQELVGAGLFGVLLPTTHGGAGAALAEAMRVFEAVARADASVGWTVTIGASGWCDLAGLPRATFDELFSEPGTIVAGAFNPAGSITEVAGGFRVNGRAYRSGGGSSIYAECPLQRRFRDIHAITQHFLVRPDTLTTAGAILARRDVDVMVF